jgi:hypothetical protein
MTRPSRIAAVAQPETTIPTCSTSHIADAGADMNGPLPAWFVGGLPDSHGADVNELEPTLLEEAGLVGLVKALQHDVEIRAEVCHRPDVARLS